LAPPKVTPFGGVLTRQCVPSAEIAAGDLALASPKVTPFGGVLIKQCVLPLKLPQVTLLWRHQKSHLLVAC